MGESRGAVILTGVGGGWTPDPSALRAGAMPLLARVLEQVAPVAASVVVAPATGLPAPGLRPPWCERVRVLPPADAPTSTCAALLAAEALLPAAAETVVVLTGDLAFLTTSWLERLTAALEPGHAAICAAEGAAWNPWAAVYRRAALRDGGAFARRCAAGDAAHPVGPELGLFPALPDAAGQPGPALPVRDEDTYRRALAWLGLCDPAAPAVTLELYGNLRIRTGCAGLPIHAGTVAAAVAALFRVHPEAGRLLGPPERLGEHFRFALNGEAVTTDPEYPLRAGDRLVLFSAAVGG